MSSRQLRKLQKQQALEKLGAQHEEQPGAGSEPETTLPAPKPKLGKFSGFAVLGDVGDDEDSEDQQEKEEVEEEESIAGSSRETQQDENDAAATVAPKKKKKKKKKKSKNQNAGENANANAKTNANQDTMDIDRAIRELKLVEKKTGKPGNAAQTDQMLNVFKINTNHLRVLNEMRNLFGREAIAAAELEEAQEEQDRQRQRAQNRRGGDQHVDLEGILKGLPGNQLPEVTRRRNPFLPGKETWPNAAAAGLTMEVVKKSDPNGVGKEAGITEFRFVHDTEYNKLETEFFVLAQMHDPMQLVIFLRKHPYHISTLIQVSKIAKQDQNSSLATDLCERALFTFGRVSLSQFRQKMEEGKARLDWRRPENRQFWLAGFYYLKTLVVKGTFRTALEWAKLLFALNPDDPYGMINFIHPLAIRAHESKWFIEFFYAILSQKDVRETDYIFATLALALLQQNDNDAANALLSKEMTRMPWFYGELFKELDIRIPHVIWGYVPRCSSEFFYTELYKQQARSLWDNPQAITLLNQAASQAKAPRPNVFPASASINESAARWAYLNDNQSLMSAMPSRLLHKYPNWEFDPLPPDFTTNIFSHETQKLPWQDDRGPEFMAGISPGDHVRFNHMIQNLAGNPRLLDELQRANHPNRNRRGTRPSVASHNAQPRSYQDNPDNDDDNNSYYQPRIINGIEELDDDIDFDNDNEDEDAWEDEDDFDDDDEMDMDDFNDDDDIIDFDDEFLPRGELFQQFLEYVMPLGLLREEALARNQQQHESRPRNLADEVSDDDMPSLIPPVMADGRLGGDDSDDGVDDDMPGLEQITPGERAGRVRGGVDNDDDMPALIPSGSRGRG